MNDRQMVMLKYNLYIEPSVDWAGKVPTHWKVMRLKTLIMDLESGVSVNASESEAAAESEVGVLKTSCVYSCSFNPDENKKVFTSDLQRVACPVKKGAIIISRMNAPDLVGASGLVKGNYNHLYLPDRLWQTKFWPTTMVSSEWLSYFLCSTRFRGEIESISTGTSPSMKNISKGGFLGLFVVVPPICEQTAIATFLDQKTTQIDQAVAIKEKQIALLKERKQILIQNAVTRGLNPDAPMRDSGVEWIGEVPEHWEVKRLRLLGSTQNGISAGAEYFGSGCPFVSYGDVYNNQELPETVTGLANSSEEEREQYSIRKGDVLFTRTSETVEEIGIASVCRSTIENSTFAGFLIRFRPAKNVLCDGFSKFYFNAPMLRDFFVKEMNLVTRASLSQELLKNLMVLLPPLHEQKEIASHIEIQYAKIDKAISLQQQQIERLKEYKATLINSAVTGKIRVPGVVEPEGETA